MKAKLKDIKLFYKFSPNISMWISPELGKSFITKLYEETWYGEDSDIFTSGYYIFIQLKMFAIHFSISWWKLKLKR